MALIVNPQIGKETIEGRNSSLTRRLAGKCRLSCETKNLITSSILMKNFYLLISVEGIYIRSLED